MPDFLKPNLPTPEPDPERNNVIPRPLQAIEGVLKAVANAPADTLDPQVKAKQKQALLKAYRPVTSMESKTSSPFITWLRWSSGILATATVAIVILALILNQGTGFRLGPTADRLASAITIPAAQAADAFSLVPEASDRAGMPTDSGWIVDSKVAVSSDDLAKSIKIDPPVDFKVEESSPGRFKIEPTADLEPGQVYRVTLAAQVEDAEGNRRPRDFAWAIQTKQGFNVVSTIPANRATGVPVNTGIEFRFSGEFTGQPPESFSMTPAVAGRFETRGRTLTFVPARPLEAGRLYEANLKAGFGAANDSPGLTSDVKVQFETQVAQIDKTKTRPLIHGEFFEIAVNKAERLVVYAADGSAANQEVEITAYKLDAQAARNLLDKRANLPSWAQSETFRYEGYEQAKKAEAFRATSKIERINYSEGINLPAFKDRGFYIVRLQPLAPSAREASWAFFQVTDIASYILADKDKLVVWVVNTASKQPIANLSARLGSDTLQTDNRGQIEFATPDVLKPDYQFKQGERNYALIEFGSGDNALFAIVNSRGEDMFYRYGTNNLISENWGYVYTDRPLYRINDQIQFYGLVRNRNTGSTEGKLTARIRSHIFLYDHISGDETGKIYAETELKQDAAGRFEGALAWNRLAPNRWYVVEIFKDGKRVASRSFEVREFGKPAYSLEILPDTSRVYAGDTVKGRVRATFFDGTPLINTDLRLSWYSPKGAREALPLTTDDSGEASFAIPTTRTNCTLAEQSPAYCPMAQYIHFTVEPMVGEEGEVFAQSSVNLYDGALAVELESQIDGARADVQMQAWHRDLLREDTRGAAAPNQKLDGRIYPRYWTIVQDGVRYDPISKTTVPEQRWVERFDPSIPFSVITDAQGKANFRFEARQDRSYSVVVNSLDKLGRTSQVQGWVNAISRSNFAEEQPHLELLPKKGSNRSEFELGQKVTAKLKQGSEPYDISKLSPVLYVLASRGIVHTQVASNTNYEFEFNDRLVPNAEIRAIVYTDNGFVTLQNTAYFKAETKRLRVELTPDRRDYAPGSQVRVRAKVVNENGQAARNVRLGWGAVDKALLAIAPRQPATPLEELYAYVPDGILAIKETHADLGVRGSGAEGGGGGEGDYRTAARRNFKDTAAFGSVETNAKGEAIIEFKAPDNLTAWNLEAIALSDSLEAGASATDIKVAKPVFVDLVLAPRLLASDKPLVKLRGFGSGLREGSTVTYRLQAPALGWNDKTVSGKAGEAVFIAPEALPPGKHKVIVGIESSSGKDSLERELEVVNTRYFRDEYVSIEAAPGATLPPINTAEVEVSFMSKSRSSLLPLIGSLAGNDMPRLDAKVASLLMTELLQSEFKKTDLAAPQFRLADYQDTYEGGLQLLPYSSQDIELSSEVAATAPELVGNAALSDYFYRALSKSEVTRLEQIAAVSGLAALKEPVLPSLQAFADQKDLSWRELLYVARGLEAAGDRERARGLLERLLEKTVLRDAVMSIEISDKRIENYEATADAAALAIRLGHPKAEALKTYIDTNWQAEGFPALARVRYVMAAIENLPGRTISLTYALSRSQSETLTFAEEPVITRTLTEEEAASLVITRVDGPVDLVFVRRSPGRPAAVPEVTIRRSYHPLAGGPVVEGSIVRVNLTFSIDEKAQDGCYLVRDHLPGGWQAVLNWQAGYEGSWPISIENGEVSFYACKNPKKPEQTISYIARVVARGIYTAEAPVIQHMQYPSVAATGQDEQITIK